MSYPPRRQGFLSFSKVAMAWRLAKREIVSTAGFALGGSLTAFAAFAYTPDPTAASPIVSFVTMNALMSLLVLGGIVPMRIARIRNIVRQGLQDQRQTRRGPKGPAP